METQKLKTANLTGIGALFMLIWIVADTLLSMSVLKFLTNLCLMLAISLLTEYPQKIMQVNMNEMGKIRKDEPEAKG